MRALRQAENAGALQSCSGGRPTKWGPGRGDAATPLQAEAPRPWLDVRAAGLLASISAADRPSETVERAGARPYDHEPHDLVQNRSATRSPAHKVVSAPEPTSPDPRHPMQVAPDRSDPPTQEPWPEVEPATAVVTPRPRTERTRSRFSRAVASGDPTRSRRSSNVPEKARSRCSLVRPSLVASAARAAGSAPHPGWGYGNQVWHPGVAHGCGTQGGAVADHWSRRDARVRASPQRTSVGRDPQHHTHPVGRSVVVSDLAVATTASSPTNPPRSGSPGCFRPDP